MKPYKYGRTQDQTLTSCSSEPNWSLFGNIFTETRNRLTLERTRKIAFIRSNSSSAVRGADEAVTLSVADLEDGG
jgi:hypothetical protein